MTESMPEQGALRKFPGTSKAELRFVKGSLHSAMVLGSTS